MCSHFIGPVFEFVCMYQVCSMRATETLGDPQFLLNNIVNT